jgi:glycosyltransferase involved in cell wall biosynthesis
MKNIFIIEPSGNLYGSEMVLFDIITNCNPEKYKFSIVLPPNKPFNKILRDNGFRTFEILNISSSLQKIFSYIRLSYLILINKPDLIFVNQAGIQKIISTIALIFKIPVVSEVSTLEDGLLVNKFSGKYYVPVKSFICNSKFIADNLKVPIEKKSILYYGYQWKSLNPKVSDKTNPFKIILLGRISESKGHFLLVDAINILINERPDINIKVYFVGDAPNMEIENDIRNKINSYELTSNFIFKGFQTDINKELSGMNLMIIPSIQEPFGRIFCETAEAKLPCIVADTGGLGELSEEFNLGIRFNGKDAHDLSNKIAFAFDNYTEIKKEFQESAHDVLHKLDKIQYINKIEEIIDNSILNNNVSINWFGTNE